MELEFRGRKFKFEDTKTAPGLVKEIFADNYKVFEKGVEFRDGDIVIDCGANEGFFSVMIAKCFPNVRVISIEPVPVTFQTLKKNVELNECKNIECLPYGLGKKGQIEIEMVVSKDFSGGSSGVCTFNPEHHYTVKVPTFTIDQVFDMLGIDKVRLMKMDVEGMEYDILYGSKVLKKVDYFTAEFHTNAKLDYLGRRMDGLTTWVANQTQFIHVSLCKMCE